jgi:hypothetical protein
MGTQATRSRAVFAAGPNGAKRVWVACGYKDVAPTEL